MHYLNFHLSLNSLLFSIFDLNSPFWGHQLLDSVSTLNAEWFPLQILSLITSTKTQFPNESTFTAPEVRTWMHLLEGHDLVYLHHELGHQFIPKYMSDEYHLLSNPFGPNDHSGINYSCQRKKYIYQPGRGLFPTQDLLHLSHVNWAQRGHSSKENWMLLPQ